MATHDPSKVKLTVRVCYSAQLLMTMKKLDIIKSEFLNALVRTLNSLEVQKEDLVGIYPPIMGNNEYQAIFYYEEKEK